MIQEEDTNPLRGYLVIFVDGYKIYDSHLFHVMTDGENQYTVPDRFVPPPRHEIGSMEWWQEGWAVGENKRDRLCKRFGAKPLKKFHSFDEAVEFAYRRQQKHKTHQHILVYVTRALNGKERMDVVRSTDDIAAIDAELEAEQNAVAAARAELAARDAVDHPHLALLLEKFGSSKAWRLSNLLRQMREKGMDAAKASMSTPTFYRLTRELKECGLVPK